MKFYFHGHVFLMGDAVVAQGSFSGVSPFDGPLGDISDLLQRKIREELSLAPDSIREITLEAEVKTVDQLIPNKPAR